MIWNSSEGIIVTRRISARAVFVSRFNSVWLFISLKKKIILNLYNFRFFKYFILYFYNFNCMQALSREICLTFDNVSI